MVAYQSKGLPGIIAALYYILLQSLIAVELVGRDLLVSFPVAFGTGKRLFKIAHRRVTPAWLQREPHERPLQHLPVCQPHSKGLTRRLILTG